jgi:FkbH-like protein
LISTAEAIQVKTGEEKKVIKTVVWDLDNTIWDGILSEDVQVSLREGVAEIIKTLDARGILQSIASKNDFEQAMSKLEEFGLREYFLYPQINWNSKMSNIKAIAEAINIGLDAVAFIDDQAFERDEVNYTLPQVLCIDAAELAGLLERPEMNPRFITEDSRLRRSMYLSDMRRNVAEQEFVGPKEEFLATLGMVFSISAAKEEDLQRAEELTVRTNQLNTTGRTYSYAELDEFRRSPNHILLVAGLKDVYGTYGKIGLVLIERHSDRLLIRLLLMSCRVMSRGVGTILISHIKNLARQLGLRLQAEFIPNGRNRMMYVAYKFAGFTEVERAGDCALLECDLTREQSFPDYVKVEIAA